MSDQIRPVFNKDGQLIGVGKDLSNKQLEYLRKNGFSRKRSAPPRRERRAQERAAVKRDRRKEDKKRERRLKPQKKQMVPTQETPIEEAPIPGKIIILEERRRDRNR